MRKILLSIFVCLSVSLLPHVSTAVAQSAAMNVEVVNFPSWAMKTSRGAKAMKKKVAGTPAPFEAAKFSLMPKKDFVLQFSHAEEDTNGEKIEASISFYVHELKGADAQSETDHVMGHLLDAEEKTGDQLRVIAEDETVLIRQRTWHHMAYDVPLRTNVRLRKDVYVLFIEGTVLEIQTSISVPEKRPGVTQQSKLEKKVTSFQYGAAGRQIPSQTKTELLDEKTRFSGFRALSEMNQIIRSTLLTAQE